MAWAFLGHRPSKRFVWSSLIAVIGIGQLDEGRRIYRDGEVRELELTAKDAIIHRRIDKKDEYAVIEWDGNGLAVRSQQWMLTAAGIGAAGRHVLAVQ